MLCGRTSLCWTSILHLDKIQYIQPQYVVNHASFPVPVFSGAWYSSPYSMALPGPFLLQNEEWQHNWSWSYASVFSHHWSVTLAASFSPCLFLWEQRLGFPPHAACLQETENTVAMEQVLLRRSSKFFRSLWGFLFRSRKTIEKLP